MTKCIGIYGVGSIEGNNDEQVCGMTKCIRIYGV